MMFVLKWRKVGEMEVHDEVGWLDVLLLGFISVFGIGFVYIIL